MTKKSGFLVLLLAVLTIYISIRSASPPAVVMGAVPDSSFSVKRAFTHLTEISRLPHSTGTAQNKVVREYIAAACRQAGFEVQIQDNVATNRWGQYINAANVHNVVARKKGLHNSKCVVLMCHYDSEPNTPGAGDDGAAAAAMLETARALQPLPPLQNDLVLLFTDGEEIGLMGANAFLADTSIIKQIGLVINFEGRGNAGPSNMFEVNSNNGWIINEYAKSVAHPFANSLGYEIYKKLPNGTDFTIFKNAGITGLNNAYIDGFVNYHSPNDTPENMDQRSLQHHGDNMLSLVKHFGNVNIVETKAPDVSYFNVIGSWFVHYPASWNLVFVAITNILFIWFLFAGFKNRYIKPGGFVIGSLLFPVVLAIIYFSVRYLLKKILAHYPMYSHFDGNNSYNSSWYFFAMSAWAVTIFSFIYFLVAKKIKLDVLLAGILLTITLLMDAMQYAIPSASYLLFIPLIFILIARIIKFHKNLSDTGQYRSFEWWAIVSSLPAILFLAPVIHSTFIAFALSPNMPFVVIAVGLFAGLLLPILHPAFKGQKALVPLVALVCFVGGILGGHFNAGYSKKHPLQSSLGYALDADSAKATWVSDYKTTDKWTATFFKGGGKNKDSHHNWGLTTAAPVLPLQPPTAMLAKDTMQDGLRVTTIHLNAMREKINFLNIGISDSSTVMAVSIAGKTYRVSNKGEDTCITAIGYTGIAPGGIDIIFEMAAYKKLHLMVQDRSIGLPVVAGFNTSCPSDIIFARGSRVNTISVTKRFVF